PPAARYPGSYHPSLILAQPPHPLNNRKCSLSPHSRTRHTGVTNFTDEGHPMASSLATYFAFDGNTAEAMEHWHDVFGGELTIVRYGDMPPMEGMPFEPDPNAVAHSTLKFKGGEIAGSDNMDFEKEYPVRDTIYSLLYTLDDPDEARGYIDKLVAAGGEIGMPFEEAPWGDWYGQVFDKFGVMWAFSCENATLD